MTCWDGSTEACPYPDGGSWMENERVAEQTKREQEPFEPDKRGWKTQRKGPVQSGRNYCLRFCVDDRTPGQPR